MDVGRLVFVISCLCIILSGIYSVFEKSLANLLTGILILTFVLTYCLSIDFKCWVNQKLRNTDSYAEWHLGQIYDAVKDDDLDEVKHLTHNLGEWLEELGDNEKEIFEQAVQKWEKKHPYRFETIEDFYREHDDVLDK